MNRRSTFLIGMLVVFLLHVYVAANHAYGEDIDQYMLLVRHMSLTRVQTSGIPNEELFSAFFVEMGLGKVAEGGTVEGDLTRRARVFTQQDQICIVGEALQEVKITCMAYDTREKRLVGSKFSHTDPLMGGSFVAYMQVDWPSGTYELWIFVEGELVAELPFKVRQ